ncbi:MAG: formylglycine-generating enzyme family protein [Desulfovibrio sp.]|nr:formylglycine-generating enzyme family protein [Desulfovibrio sp.]
MDLKKKGIFFVFCLSVFTIVSGLSSVGAAEKSYTNSIGMEFTLIPSGSFSMGADKNFEEASDDEIPQHRVNISKQFYLGKYEVTQAQWTAVMGSNPSKFKGRLNPVEQVSWNDVQVFITHLNQKEWTTKYRLPTEAEWEYAARSSTTSPWFFGDDAGQLGRYAWYADNSGETAQRSRPVGQKEPNAWGLYDMHGNVWEWVQDWYGERYYNNSPPVDPGGPPSGSFRAKRGGSWDSNAAYCRLAYRGNNLPDRRFVNLGFRLAFSPE